MCLLVAEVGLLTGMGSGQDPRGMRWVQKENSQSKNRYWTLPGMDREVLQAQGLRQQFKVLDPSCALIQRGCA